MNSQRPRKEQRSTVGDLFLNRSDHFQCSTRHINTGKLSFILLIVDTHSSIEVSFIHITRQGDTVLFLILTRSRRSTAWGNLFSYSWKCHTNPNYMNKTKRNTYINRKKERTCGPTNNWERDDCAQEKWKRINELCRHGPAIFLKMGKSDLSEYAVCTIQHGDNARPLSSLPSA